jgi:hypothetical protein
MVGHNGKNVATLLYGKMTAKFREILREVADFGAAPPAREALTELKR